MPRGMAAMGSCEAMPSSIVAVSRWLLTRGPAVFRGVSALSRMR
jgi:hypothetical protein